MGPHQAAGNASPHAIHPNAMGPAGSKDTALKAGPPGPKDPASLLKNGSVTQQFAAEMPERPLDHQVNLYALRPRSIKAANPIPARIRVDGSGTGFGAFVEIWMLSNV